MSGTVSPVQSRRLARTLRRWREAAGYSIEQAADELLCGAGTISRMENGLSAEPLRVREAMELYGAPTDIVANMVEAAKLRRRRGVLRRPYYDFVSHTFAEYLDLENEASELSCFQSDIVHGLLQTENYARSLIDNAAEIIDDTDKEKFLSLRMARQERLRGESPLALRVILVESALYTEIGGKAVLREQLRRLAVVHRSDNIEVRVLPFNAGAHAAVGGNFSILAFPGVGHAVEPESVYTENQPFFLLQDDPREVSRIQRIYDQVWKKALDSSASADLIRAAIRRLPG